MKSISDYINNIPLYNALYGKKINDIDFISNLDHLPILERRHIIEGFPNNWMTDDLQHAMQEDRIETTTTSGTSGTRIQIFRKKGWWRDEYIRTYRYSEQLKNFNIGVDRKAILTTAICSNASCYLDFPTYEDRIISNTLYLNLNKDPNNWTKKAIEKMASELNQFKPTYLDADPIYLALFLKMAEDFGITIKTLFPDFISLSYEMTTSYSKRFIKSHLNSSLGNFYGTTELGYIYLEHNGKIKHCPELSHVEFMPFCEERGIYSLILSSIKNEYMPFLRFKVGDLVKVSPNKATGEMEINYFCGREKDIVTSLNGYVITPGEIDHALSVLENNILIYQLQFRNNNILFRYLTFNNAPLSDKDKSQIASELHALLGKDYDIHFKLERSITPEISGKFSIIKKI